MYHSLTRTYDAYHSLLIVDLVEKYKLTCQYSSKHKIANLIKSNFYLHDFLVVTLKPYFLQFLFCTTYSLLWVVVVVILMLLVKFNSSY